MNPFSGLDSKFLGFVDRFGFGESFGRFARQYSL